MVYSIQTGGLKGSLILSNNRAIVLHQGGQCGWAGGMKGWLIRAQQPRRERISCKGQDRTSCWYSKIRRNRTQTQYEIPSGVKRSTGHTHTHTTAEQTTHTNTERATAQRRLIVEAVVAAPKIVVVRFLPGVSRQHP